MAEARTTLTRRTAALGLSAPPRPSGAPPLPAAGGAQSQAPLPPYVALHAQLRQRVGTPPAAAPAKPASPAMRASHACQPCVPAMRACHACQPASVPAQPSSVPVAHLPRQALCFAPSSAKTRLQGPAGPLEGRAPCPSQRTCQNLCLSPPFLHEGGVALGVSGEGAGP